MTTEVQKSDFAELFIGKLREELGKYTEADLSLLLPFNDYRITFEKHGSPEQYNVEFKTEEQLYTFLNPIVNNLSFLKVEKI